MLPQWVSDGSRDAIARQLPRGRPELLEQFQRALVSVERSAQPSAERWERRRDALGELVLILTAGPLARRADSLGIDRQSVRRMLAKRPAGGAGGRPAGSMGATTLARLRTAVSRLVPSPRKAEALRWWDLLEPPLRMEVRLFGADEFNSWRYLPAVEVAQLRQEHGDRCLVDHRGGGWVFVLSPYANPRHLERLLFAAEQGLAGGDPDCDPMRPPQSPVRGDMLVPLMDLAPTAPVAFMARRIERYRLYELLAQWLRHRFTKAREVSGPRQ